MHYYSALRQFRTRRLKICSHAVGLLVRICQLVFSLLQREAIAHIEYMVVAFCVDTAENGLSKLTTSSHDLPATGHVAIAPASSQAVGARAARRLHGPGPLLAHGRHQVHEPRERLPLRPEELLGRPLALPRSPLARRRSRVRHGRGTLLEDLSASRRNATPPGVQCSAGNHNEPQRTATDFLKAATQSCRG